MEKEKWICGLPPDYILTSVVVYLTVEQFRNQFKDGVWRTVAGHYKPHTIILSIE